MKSFEDFLATVETAFPLKILRSKCCLSVSNSGRRGGEKAFSITVESLEQSLRDIKENIKSFPCDYDEATWRDDATKFLTDNHARTLCGTQTKPFYETINKVISWANEQICTDGELNLSAERIDKALIALEQICALNPSSVNRYLPTNNGNRPDQIIYYGVPGCGKSHEVQKETKSLPKDHVMRVVFHPDYSNADFVGQILPHVDGKDVSYEFTPGPFAKILKKALRSNEPHALVIEEINRGNAAAIFGEVFQLLDRYRDEKPAGNDDWEPNIGQSRIGWSKYSIINEELEKYIVNAKDAASGAEATVVDENKVPREHTLECGLVFHVGDGIRIPPNLSIYATMNTSDQNVFTLDNAFQRRWEMKQIPNTLNNAEEGEEKKQYECEIEATGVQWGLFRDAINELIMESAQDSGLSSMEDKRLGGWFITPDKDGVISKDAFANKVLKYLWDDAFKFDRQKHFGNVKTLEDLIERFTEDAGFNVFQDSSIKNLKSAEPIDSGEDDGPAEPADGTAES